MGFKYECPDGFDCRQKRTCPFTHTENKEIDEDFDSINASINAYVWKNA